MADFWDFLSDPRIINGIGTGLQIGGQLRQASGATEYGQAEMEAARFQAEQLQAQALDAQASGQRQAFFEERQARIVASNALAAAAGSGGGASDPDVINIIARIAQEGAYRGQVALYEGDARAKQLRLAALGTERAGANAQRTATIQSDNSMLTAGATFIKGMARDSMLGSKSGDTMFARFKGDGPPGGTFGGGGDY